MCSGHPGWAVLSRTVQPENAWVLVNLRFVSPWKTVSLKPTRMNQWSSKPPKCRSHHSQSDSKITVLLCKACIVSVIFSDVICSFIELTDHSVLWHCQNYFIITCNFTDSQDVIFFNIKNKKQKKNNELINVFKTSSNKKKKNGSLKTDISISMSTQVAAMCYLVCVQVLYMFTSAMNDELFYSVPTNPKTNVPIIFTYSIFINDLR